MALRRLIPTVRRRSPDHEPPGRQVENVGGRPPFRRPSRTLSPVAAAVAFAAVAAGWGAGAPAGHAAPAAVKAVTPNACLYSVDQFYRDTELSITASAEIVPDPEHPDATTIVPGHRIRTNVGTFSIELPDYLAPYGYAAGMLVEGLNEIEAEVWIAVRGTNTVEGVQVVGPVTVTASTTIVGDPADDGRFVSATPWVYSDPVLPEMTWTASGGDVAFAQAGAGAFAAQLPVGPGGALRTIQGSTVIRMANLAGGASLFLDCIPGRMLDATYDNGGQGVRPGAAVPFATLFARQNHVCLNELGRRLSGPVAGVPIGRTRELDPARIDLSAPETLDPVRGTTPYVLRDASLRAELSSETVTMLGSHEGSGASGPPAPLLRPNEAYPLRSWVAIEASNTVERVQTVAVSGAFVPTAADDPVGPASVWDPVTFEADLPETTWTPTGSGPIEFRAAGPGTLGTTTVVGSADPTVAPDGPTVAGTYETMPYGNVLLRLGTDRNPVSLDCVAGNVSVVDEDIAWSNLGAVAPPLGSKGRYGIVASGAGSNVFATASDPDGYNVRERPAFGIGDTSPPPPLLGGGNGFAAPPVKRPVGNRLSVRSRRVTVAGTRGRVAVRCTGRGTCSGTLRLTATRRKRTGGPQTTVALTSPVRYRVAAGRSGRVVTTLNAQGRRLVRSSRRVRAQLTVRPTGAAPQRYAVTVLR